MKLERSTDGIKLVSMMRMLMLVAAIFVWSSNAVNAAPLDYEIGNAAVRQCKLVYSDGRPDEVLPSCAGEKDFGNVTTTFTVKMVLTNEINQDVESDSVQIGAGNSGKTLCPTYQASFVGSSLPIVNAKISNWISANPGKRYAGMVNTDGSGVYGIRYFKPNECQLFSPEKYSGTALVDLLVNRTSPPDLTPSDPDILTIYPSSKDIDMIKTYTAIPQGELVYVKPIKTKDFSTPSAYALDPSALGRYGVVTARKNASGVYVYPTNWETPDVINSFAAGGFLMFAPAENSEFKSLYPGDKNIYGW